MGQQCGQTWLQTFSEINRLYNSGKQLTALQLVTWNDYEEGTEIESGVSNCVSVSANVSGNSLQWTTLGDPSTLDHYVAYISTDGQNLMPLGDLNVGTNSVNLCSYSMPDATYTLYVQAVGKPSMTNQISGPVQITSSCWGSSTTSSSLTFGSTPSAMTIASGGSGKVTVTAVPTSGTFNNAIALTCSGLPKTLTCSFSPASITPGSSAVSSSLTVGAPKLVAENHGERNNLFLGSWAFSFGLFGLTLIGKIPRKRIMTVLGAGILAAVIIGGTSCGGSPSLPPATVASPGAGTYTVTISGSSSTVQLSTIVTVTVK
jgi:hypothetical protein